MAVCLTAIPAASHAQDARSPAGIFVITSPSQAVTAALDLSPVLRGAKASMQAVRGDGLQAGLRPNPEASFVVENFGGIGGRGVYRGTTQSEATLGISQRVELGGKRTARVGLAGRSEGVAALEFEAARLDLAREVITALVEATVSSRMLEIEQGRVRIAAENLRTTRARVDAGKEALLQARRAEVGRSTAELAAEKARREAEAALRNLAAAIGVSRVEIAPRQTWFDDIGAAPAPPTPADPLERMRSNPDLTRLDAVIAQRRADLGLQRANAVPDITVQGYVRRFQESGETAFVAGASIPLPFSDRNQGGIAKAAAELTRAEAEAERGRLTMVASLIAAERQMEQAWRAVRTLRRDALPAAEQAARYAATGYAEGKFTFLELIEAQRALSDTRAQLNETLREFHVSRTEVARLRGQEPAPTAMAGAR